jgi:hypothetical protein
MDNKETRHSAERIGQSVRKMSQGSSGAVLLLSQGILNIRHFVFHVFKPFLFYDLAKKHQNDGFVKSSRCKARKN